MDKEDELIEQIGEAIGILSRIKIAMLKIVRERKNRSPAKLLLLGARGNLQSSSIEDRGEILEIRPDNGD
jgi:hypothetical protein